MFQDDTKDDIDEEEEDVVEEIMVQSENVPILSVQKSVVASMGPNSKTYIRTSPPRLKKGNQIKQKYMSY